VSETVVILGAGVSKTAGAPLMNEFLDVADRLRREFKPSNSDFELVFKGKDALQAVHSKAAMDLLNLESVFAAFEMAKLVHSLGQLSVDEIEALPSAMARVIQQTLEATIKFTFSAGRLYPPAPYTKLVELVEEVRTKSPASSNRISFITFNYDLCLDYALEYKSFGVDYCLQSPVLPNGVKLLKLHGSLNWSRCPDCGLIVPLYVRDFLSGGRMFLDSGEKTLVVSSALGRTKHCLSALASEPFIAPPTWNKTQYHAQLQAVWRAAAKELSDAENIIICGYSLPETDQFFRYLYALGSVGRSNLKRFWVVNPDEKVRPRFESLCGPLALTRFQFLPQTVESAMGEIARVLRT
jgi:hypothetical protein